MKRFMLGLVLLVGLSGCVSVTRQAVDAVGDSQEIIFQEYLQYVEKDGALDEAQKENRRGLVESARRLLEALKAEAE